MTFITIHYKQITITTMDHHHHGVDHPDYLVLPGLIFGCPLRIVPANRGGTIPENAGNILDGCALPQKLAGKRVAEPVRMSSIYLRTIEHRRQRPLRPFDQTAHRRLAA